MRKPSQFVLPAVFLAFMLMAAMLSGCYSAGGTPSSHASAASDSNTAPPTAQPMKEDSIRTIFTCTVLEDPIMTTEGAPHWTDSPGVPVADICMLKSQVSIDKVFMGTPRKDDFHLYYEDEGKQYDLKKGSEYFVIMTEDSPGTAYIDYDNVFLINKSGKLDLLTGIGTVSPINGMTVEEAVGMLGIPAE